MTGQKDYQIRLQPCIDPILGDQPSFHFHRGKDNVCPDTGGQAFENMTTDGPSRGIDLRAYEGDLHEYRINLPVSIVNPFSFLSAM
jgi:hypothetical protein